MTAPLHTLGMHANHLARQTSNERMQATLQWVGVGSIIVMGVGALVHLYRDLCKPSSRETYPPQKYRELRDDIDRSIERGERDHGRGR